MKRNRKKQMNCRVDRNGANSSCTSVNQPLIPTDMHDDSKGAKTKNKTPIWGMIALLFATLGNLTAYGMMASSNNGPSDLGGAIIGLLLGLATVFIVPFTALFSFVIEEKPSMYSTISLLVEAIVLTLYFKMN